MEGKIFISYRRDDTKHVTGRLCDRLVSHFGGEKVFIDIDEIAGGDDFVEAIRAKLESCDVRRRFHTIG
jgi:hypothetical protein